MYLLAVITSPVLCKMTLSEYRLTVVENLDNIIKIILFFYICIALKILWKSCLWWVECW